MSINLDRNLSQNLRILSRSEVQILPKKLEYATFFSPLPLQLPMSVDYFVLRFYILALKTLKRGLISSRFNGVIILADEFLARTEFRKIEPSK